MSLEFVATDLTQLAVDAIVIPCSPHPIMTEGMNDMIYTAGNSALLAARQKIGALPFGRAAITSGFTLPAKSAIHVAIPPYQENTLDTLHHAYRTVFRLAEQNQLTTLGLPLLGYYAQNYPYNIARTILTDALSCSEVSDDLILKLTNTHLPRPLCYHDIQNYLSSFSSNGNLFLSVPDCTSLCESDTHTVYRLHSRVQQELTEKLSHRESGFSPTLLSLISQRGENDPAIYKKANIDRKLFSKIRTNPEYQPTKSTALAFAIALELDINETNDFLRTAGYTLTHTSKRDIIIEYFILRKNYDIFTINEALFAFGESSLGYN